MTSQMSDTVLNWYAVYVQSKCEFVAKDQLLRRGVECYLPSVRKLSQWKDRKKWLNQPVFPGYLFVRVHPKPKEFVLVLKTHGIVSILGSRQGLPTPVAQDEIMGLRMLVGSGKDFDVHNGLKEGASVRIRKGPLEGIRGVLRKAPPNEQCVFAINIEILGRSVCVIMQPDEIEPA